MTTYFQQPAGTYEPRPRRTYEVTPELLEVLTVDHVREPLRPMARELGVGSAMSSPSLLHRDLVSLYDATGQRVLIASAATGALLGGSMSRDGELEATGITFSMGSGVLGFLTFAIPAALLIPGGSFFVAYRLFRMVRDTASLRRYARVSQAAPHVAIAVAASDRQITRDEARLLRDLLRGRVGSPEERYGLLALELDPTSKQEAALDALAGMQLSEDDWPALLSIAIATAHADDDYSDDERALITRLADLTELTSNEFQGIAAQAESDYLTRCHLGEAMMRACYAVACGGDAQPPDDARLLLDTVLQAAIPGDAARARLSSGLLAGELAPMEAAELVRGASDEKPGLFKRVTGARSERQQRVDEFGRTMALFLATLEQWRGWVVRPCRTRLTEIGASYGLDARKLTKWVEKAHRNIQDLRQEWIEPMPWELPDHEPESAFGRRELPTGAFGVTSLSAGRFLFHRGDDGWEWFSSEQHFDIFVQQTLAVEERLAIHADETTFELLIVTIEAHGATIVVSRVS